ncbi:MAG: hypothetical protein P4L53_12470 [Candidatus Obscuribacterales bacterium]|nr:hypothetical protein [Candidatus Obscuribacterales bacterium]
MELWIGVGLFVILLAVIAVVSAKVSRLLSAKHLSEISDCMARLKIAALKAMVRPGEPDPYEQNFHPDQVAQQTLVTSAGLGLMYTVSKQDDLYSHHISMSSHAGSLAHSAAMTIATWISYFLNIPVDEVGVPPELSNAPGFVWHMTFVLSEEEEHHYEQARPRILTVSDITPAMWKQLGSARESIVERSLANQRSRCLDSNSRPK